PNFRDNHINNFDRGSGFSYGISSNFTNSPLLSLNYVYSSNSQGGAIFNKCNAGYVYNENYFSLLSQSERQSCIELNGGMGNQVYNNHFDATTPSPFTEAFGLRASAGGVGSVFCNDFFQIEEAIVAEHGQTDVELKTNNLYDTRVGIKIDKSVLGIQTHHGNLFTGPFGDMALLGVDLTFSQVTNSQFVVNGNINSSHVPLSSQVSPAGLKDVQNNGTAPICNSISYTTSPRDRLLALCDYINSIKNNNTLDPIRKKNLLAFYFRLLAKYFPEVNKPYCINQFIAAYNNSNIKRMNTVEAKIDQLLAPQEVIPILRDNHKLALTAYLDAIESNSNVASMRNIYYTAANALQGSFVDRTNIENQLILDIMSEINAFIPEDNYEEAWLTVQLSFVKLFSELKLDISEMAALQEVAALCPTDYGDVVYGARALLSDLDNTRYELAECMPDAPRKAKVVVKNERSVFIMPNPATSMIELNIANDQAQYSIEDIAGKIIVVNTSYKRQEKIDVSSLRSGLYFIKIFEDGVETTHKFIKIE
ncbi:MAG TPA: T9SS type A sorting domain-containing protein, partial [Saprospiraceae bacterium]|nr:T9SS type A sorting domain-containing protein [Saprospiraceae bacterium]